MSDSAAHVYVSGYVQGVFFRVSTARQAQRLGVTGWVRNLADGRVEAMFQGDDAAVRSIVEWCRSGPPHASVESVDVSWEETHERFTLFEMI